MAGEELGQIQRQVQNIGTMTSSFRQLASQHNENMSKILKDVHSAVSSQRKDIGSFTEAVNNALNDIRAQNNKTNSYNTNYFSQSLQLQQSMYQQMIYQSRILTNISRSMVGGGIGGAVGNAAGALASGSKVGAIGSLVQGLAGSFGAAAGPIAAGLYLWGSKNGGNYADKQQEISRGGREPVDPREVDQAVLGGLGGGNASPDATQNNTSQESQGQGLTPNNSGSMNTRNDGNRDAVAFLSSHSIRGSGYYSGANADKLNPGFAEKLMKGISAAEEATGSKIQITEGWRDSKRQAQYYANYIKGPVTWEGKTYYPDPRTGSGGLAAPPGQSKHQTGNAVDLSSSPAREWLRKHASEFGLTDLGSKDMPHFQNSGGGNEGEKQVASRKKTGDGGIVSENKSSSQQDASRNEEQSSRSYESRPNAAPSYGERMPGINEGNIGGNIFGQLQGMLPQAAGLLRMAPGILNRSTGIDVPEYGESATLQQRDDYERRSRSIMDFATQDVTENANFMKMMAMPKHIQSQSSQPYHGERTHVGASEDLMRYFDNRPTGWLDALADRFGEIGSNIKM